jgi:hypothetical protein
MHDCFMLQVIVFERGDLVFVFNFHPDNTYDGYVVFNYAKGSMCSLHVECWQDEIICKILYFFIFSFSL